MVQLTIRTGCSDQCPTAEAITTRIAISFTGLGTECTFARCSRHDHDSAFNLAVGIGKGCGVSCIILQALLILAHVDEYTGNMSCSKLMLSSYGNCVDGTGH